MRKHRAWGAAVAAVVAVGLTAALWAAEKNDSKPAGPPPLKVDKAAPLLLDGPAPKTGKPAGPKADNSACHVCHANYEDEPLAVWHANQNLGCVKCHGESFDHRNDEDNITPPDIIYPAARIDAACRKCHETHDVAAAKVVARWQDRCPGKKAKDLVCTDCHGAHRLKNRTVRWDKETKKLITGKGEK